MMIDDGNLFLVGHRPIPFTKAVGWNVVANPATDAEQNEELLAQLRPLLVRPWGTYIVLGGCRCPLCPADGPRPDLWLGHTQGCEGIFVPSGNAVLVASKLVPHHITHHGYEPGPEFREAVRACPPMGSPEYLEQLRAVGDGAFWREIHVAR